MLEGPDPSASRAVHDELLAILNARAIPRTVIAPGETDRTQPALAWDPVVRVEVLNAGGGRAIGGEGESDWINNDSIVLRIGYGAVEFVLGADAESPVQQRLVTLGLPLESEALKVHHHGVASDTDPGYLDAVNPRLALIPICTYETYDGGLPSAVVLDRLRQRNVDIYASDRAEPLGILLAGDGGSCAVRVEPSRSQHYPGDSWALAPPGDFE
jgi:beta-lactamase superfamily II metal-dependent hydrolase